MYRVYTTILHSEGYYVTVSREFCLGKVHLRMLFHEPEGRSACTLGSLFGAQEVLTSLEHPVSFAPPKWGGPSGVGKTEGGEETERGE